MSRARRTAWAWLGVGVAGAVLSAVPWTLEVEEALGLAWLFELRGPLERPDSVAVVGISGDSADAFGLSYDLDEWPRGLHAQLLDALDAAGAAVIVMDIIFEAPGPPDQDRQLAAAIERAGNVILLERVRSEQLAIGVLERHVPPIEPLRRAAAATAPFVLPTVPLKTSQFWTFGRAESNVPSLPAAALQLLAMPVYGDLVERAEAIAPEAAARLPRGGRAGAAHELSAMMRDVRDVFVADPRLREPAVGDGGADRLLAALWDLYASPANRYLNYYGPSGTLETIPFHEMLGGGAAADHDLRGKVVFVGFSERRQPEQQDDFISVYSERSGLNLSGVEIGATAFANLLDGTGIEPLPLPWHLALVLVWGIVLTAALTALPSGAATVAAPFAGAGYLASAWYAFGATGTWMPVVVPLLVQLPLALAAAVLVNYRDLRRHRGRIEAALSYYVPGHVIARLARDSFDPQSTRELVYGSCLVSDAEEFTRLSESLDPESLGELMDEYYEVLRSTAEKHGGYVADLSGDSMVATWTAAAPLTGYRDSACAAALELQQRLDLFNAEHAPRRLPTGIGLESGQMLLGSIGARHPFQFRAVGDIVNSAARIEGLNRRLKTRTLASAAAVDGVNGVLMRRVGSFLLAGKTTPLDVYELLGAERDADAGARARAAMFAQPLELFCERRFAAARDAFEGLLAEYPEDGPSRFYVEQCERMAADPPGDGWSGTIRMTSK